MQSEDLDSCQFSSQTTTLFSPRDQLEFLNTSDNELDHNYEEVEPECDIVDQTGEDDASLTLCLTNVVVMASMGCHLRLKEIARSSVNVEYKPLQNHVIMRLKSPNTVATIWSSGKIWCTGANSLAKAKIGARRIARRIAKCGFPCRFSKYRIVNIMATCRLPFRVRLEELIKEKPMLMSYEPELAPGLTFKLDRNSSTSLKLFSTGRIVIMGSSLESISQLVEELVPLAALHQTDEPVCDDYEDEDQVLQEKPNESKVSRLMKMISSSVPEDTLNALVADDDYNSCKDSSHDSDSEDNLDPDEFINNDSPSTSDDSFYSGASVDSGGVSLRPKKRRKKSKLRQTASTTHNHLFSVYKPQSGSSKLNQSINHHINENSELNIYSKTNMVNSDVNPVSNHYVLSKQDPTWCRKAVASGSTKRACITAYTGSEDSKCSENVNNNNFIQIIQPSEILNSAYPRLKVIRSSSIKPLSNIVQGAGGISPYINTNSNKINYSTSGQHTLAAITTHSNTDFTNSPTSVLDYNSKIIVCSPNIADVTNSNKSSTLGFS